MLYLRGHEEYLITAAPCLDFFLDESTFKEIAAVKQAAEALKKIPGVTALQFAEMYLQKA